MVLLPCDCDCSLFGILGTQEHGHIASFEFGVLGDRGDLAAIGAELRKKFLNDGNRVKVTVRFRGREMAHTSLGEQLLKQFGADCDEVATVAKGAKLEGRNMSMFLSPKNSK